MGDAAGVPPRFGLFIGSLRFAALSAIGVVVGTRTYLQSLWTQNGGVFSLPSDESYVLLHPARRLMEGTGLQGLEDVVTFGSSLVQDGLSSPSYAVVLAVAAQLGVGVEALPQLVVILGMAAHWVVLNALAQICDRIAPRWAKYVLLLVFAAGMPMTLRWAISGSLGAWGMAHVGVLLVQWQTLMDRDPVAESAAGPARRREATRRAEWFLGLLGLITWLAQPHALPLVLALAASIAIRRGWLGGAVAALAGAIRVLLPTAIVAGPLLHVLRSQADWPALSALNALWSPAMPAAVGNLVYGSWVQVNFEQLLAAVAPAPVPAVLTVVVSAAALLWARARLLVMTLFVLAAVAIFTLSLRPILEAPDDLARYESYGWLLLLWTLGLSLSLDALWRRPIRWGGVFSKLTGAAGLVALLSLVIARGGRATVRGTLVFCACCAQPE